MSSTKRSSDLSPSRWTPFYSVLVPFKGVERFRFLLTVLFIKKIIDYLDISSIELLELF